MRPHFLPALPSVVLLLDLKRSFQPGIGFENRLWSSISRVPGGHGEFQDYCPHTQSDMCRNTICASSSHQIRAIAGQSLFPQPPIQTWLGGPDSPAWLGSPPRFFFLSLAVRTVAKSLSLGIMPIGSNSRPAPHCLWDPLAFQILHSSFASKIGSVVHSLHRPGCCLVVCIPLLPRVWELLKGRNGVTSFSVHPGQGWAGEGKPKEWWRVPKEGTKLQPSVQQCLFTPLLPARAQTYTCAYAHSLSLSG